MGFVGKWAWIGAGLGWCWARNRVALVVKMGRVLPLFYLRIGDFWVGLGNNCAQLMGITDKRLRRFHPQPYAESAHYP